MRPGIVDVRDLSSRYRWRALEIETLVAAAGLDVDPSPAWRDFSPPRVLVIVARFDSPEWFVPSIPWLRECDHVVVVRDRKGDLDVTDAELAGHIAELWQGVLAPLSASTVFDWFDDDSCRAAIDHAIALAADLPERPRIARESPDVELPMSKWLPYQRAVTYLDAYELVAHSLVFEAGRAFLIDAHGTIDLAAPGNGPITLDHIDVALRSRTLAYPAEQRNPYRAIGVDPIHPIAARGYRMTAELWYASATEVGRLSTHDHDYPTGPGKKLWGFKNNDPVAVYVTPSADAAALLFEHDVTVLSNVPIAWHRAGAVDVALFAADPRRACLFSNESEWIAEQDPLTEDCREFPPAFVLGPSPAARYAVDLQHRTFRVSGSRESAERVDLGGPDDGYLVFDADHTVMRRGTGRLLGGWYRYATIEDSGSLWREDLATGERVHLGSALRVAWHDPELDHALQDAVREGRADALADLGGVRAVDGKRWVVAIPGTRNVVELTETMLRVV